MMRRGFRLEAPSARLTNGPFVSPSRKMLQAASLKQAHSSRLAAKANPAPGLHLGKSCYPVQCSFRCFDAVYVRKGGR